MTLREQPFPVSPNQVAQALVAWRIRPQEDHPTHKGSGYEKKLTAHVDRR